jgi:hypothetical protein
LRAIRTDLSTSESPERFVLSLGRHFSVEPNLLEPIRTDLREQSALTAGDLLVHEGQQLLVVEAGHDGPPLVADMAAGEVSELSAPSVAVVTQVAQEHHRVRICELPATTRGMRAAAGG